MSNKKHSNELGFVVVHDPVRFYSTPVIKMLKETGLSRDITFCENAKEALDLVESSVKAPKVFFIDGRIPNCGAFNEEKEPGENLFHSGTKLYLKIREKHPTASVVIFTTDHRELVYLNGLHDSHLRVLQADLDLKDHIALIIRKTTKPSRV
ncbi:MAG: hypothetical protein WCO09_00135 [bacterium]